VDSDSNAIAEFLIEAYPGLDFFAKDSIEGNTPLHLACRNRNHDLARRLFTIRPEKCLTQNFKGQSPFFIATQVQDMSLLEMF
jgi:ankyrin repeat protein